ncbi:mads-box protein svp [Quercus suber]|uniref:Mads-box protein svp n=1 Tax=Quercus suber TaxID=58331 RepID=A0AAW0LRW0_QUESU
MQQVIERHNLHPKNLGKMDQLSLELQLENGTPYAMLSKEIEEKTHELRKIRGEELPGMDIEELQKLEKELEVGLSRVIETKACLSFLSLFAGIIMEVKDFWKRSLPFSKRSCSIL